MKNLRIVVCEQDVIATMAPLLHEFMRVVFDLDSNECLVTDESSLSDFVPDDRFIECEVLEKIMFNYGIEPNVGDKLIVILSVIESLRAPRQLQ